MRLPYLLKFWDDCLNTWRCTNCHLYMYTELLLKIHVSYFTTCNYHSRFWLLVPSVYSLFLILEISPLRPKYEASKKLDNFIFIFDSTVEYNVAYLDYFYSPTVIKLPQVVIIYQSERLWHELLALILWIKKHLTLEKSPNQVFRKFKQLNLMFKVS